MALFRRHKPLHERLAEEGGLVEAAAPRGPAAQPPGWDGEQRGEPGVHGVPRPKRWDAVTTADVVGLQGDEVRFVALPDGTILTEEDEPDEALAKLAAAIEERLPAPYRAEAVRRGSERWAVAASKITLLRVRGADGDEIVLSVGGGGRMLSIDGEPSFGSVPDLERFGEQVGESYVVRAKRVDGHLWEVEASPL